MHNKQGKCWIKSKFIWFCKEKESPKHKEERLPSSISCKNIGRVLQSVNSGASMHAVVFRTRIFTRFIQRFTQYAAGWDFSQISQISQIF